MRTSSPVCFISGPIVRTDVAQPSVVERIARHTTFLFSSLHSIRKSLPPLDQRPPGTEAFLWGISTTRPKDVNDIKGIKEKDSQEVRCHNSIQGV